VHEILLRCSRDKSADRLRFASCFFAAARRASRSRPPADRASSVAGFTFIDRGVHALKGVPEPRQVFALT
jgi:hypothetical protein